MTYPRNKSKTERLGVNLNFILFYFENLVMYFSVQTTRQNQLDYGLDVKMNFILSKYLILT